MNEQMIFSKRLELAKKVNEWLDAKSQPDAEVSANAFNVITALQALGYTISPNQND